MERATFEKKVQEFKFRMIFKSTFETVWKKGGNQVELINNGEILLSRGVGIVVTMHLETLEDVYSPKNTYPETLVFASTNGVAAEFSLCH